MSHDKQPSCLCTSRPPTTCFGPSKRETRGTRDLLPSSDSGAVSCMPKLPVISCSSPLASLRLRCERPTYPNIKRNSSAGRLSALPASGHTRLRLDYMCPSWLSGRALPGVRCSTLLRISLLLKGGYPGSQSQEQRGDSQAWTAVTGA